jgi:hypothetical protein
MYSAPAVECVLVPDEGFARDNSLSRLPIPPRHLAMSAGLEPARLSATDPMYSSRQSGCIRKIDEGVTQRRYGALPLELRRCALCELRRWDSNPQPPAFEACTPNRQSIFVFKWRRRDGQRLPHGNRTRHPPSATTGPDALDGPDVLQPAVAVVSFPKGPTKGCREPLSLRPSVSAAQGELTVDGPLRLRETPAPFTSRSPGIATSGPSYVLPAGSWATVL